MDNITFDLWFTENSFLVTGSSKWVDSFSNKPIDSLFEYLRSSERIDNIGLSFISLTTKFLKQVETIDSVLLSANVAIELSENVKQEIFTSIPLCAGSEYINNDWIEYNWQLMQEWLFNTINNSKDSIESCLSLYLPDFNVADRTYFHLVETENEKFPFGFLTSYTTAVNNRVKHMPLSYALEEFKNDEKNYYTFINHL